jgi:hypothetical protein
VLGKWSTLSVPELRKMVERYGWSAMKWAGAELDPAQAKQLFLDLGSKAGIERMIRDDVDPARARMIVDTVGVDAVRAMLPNGSPDAWVSMLGTDNARASAEYQMVHEGGRLIGAYSERLDRARQPGGALDHVEALGDQSVILDTNYLGSVRDAKRAIAEGRTPSRPDQAILDDFNRRRSRSDVRVANMTVAEFPPEPGDAPLRGFALDVDRNSTEYRGFLSRLFQAEVGGPGAEGAGDRAIVADAFFAKSSRTPTLVTGDRRLLEGLARMEMARMMRDPANKGVNEMVIRKRLLDPNRTLGDRESPTVFTPGAAGFTITDAATGRRLHVVGIR